MPLPYLGMSMLTQTPWIGSHYPAGLVPGMAYAAIVGLRRLLSIPFVRRWLSLTRHRRLIVPGLPLLLFAILGGVLQGPAALLARHLTGPEPFGANLPVNALATFGIGPASSTYRDWTNLIPPGVLVVAQEEARQRFSARRDIVAFSPHFDYRQADYVVGKKGFFFYDLHKPAWDAWWSFGYFQMLLDKDGYFVAKRKDPAHLLDIRFGTKAKLLGYTIWPEPPLVGGTTLKPMLLWQGIQPISERYAFRVQLVDSQGHVWAGQTVDASTPTTWWQPGKNVGDQYSLELPALMPTGEYQVVVEVHSASGEYLEAFDTQGASLGTGIILATVHVDKSNQTVAAGELEIGNRLYVDVQDLRFMGYELAGRFFAPGDLVQLGLYWKARSAPSGDYSIAVQIRDAENHVLFEESRRPVAGTYPTNEWKAGEGLLDWRDFQIPPSFARGAYRLVLVVQSAGDRANLGEIQLTDVTIGGK